MKYIEERRLTTEQAKELSERIRPMLVFLLRFRNRLGSGGFECDKNTGNLYYVVANAHEAMHHLFGLLLQESCSSGVGRPRKEE